MGSREDQTGDAWSVTQDPELEDLLRAWARQIKLAIRTHVPATLVAYNPATNRALLSVEILQVVRVTDAAQIPKGITSLIGVPPNAEAVLAPVQLKDVPVQWPSTSKGWITFELTPGDTGMLHVSDRSLEAWLLKGIPTDPIFPFTHALKDSVWHPGQLPSTKPFVPPPDVAATVIQGTAIKLGPLAVSTAIKGTELVALIDAAIAAAITAGAGTPGSGAAAFTAFQGTWNTGKALIESAKVKVE